MNDFESVRQHLFRQIEHWVMASERLKYLEGLASAESWASLEQYLNLSLREVLLDSVNKLLGDAQRVRRQLKDAVSNEDLKIVAKKLERVRRQYFRTEVTMEFYTNAINSRTTPELTSQLQACDIMAFRCMQELLGPLEKSIPPVLTYIGTGPGASVLKAGLKLWDGRVLSPAAAIKIVRHNLYRPTALIHEAGHQAAHILNWNNELAEALRNALRSDSTEIAEIWSSWSSEIAADAFAFVHTGYAAVANLHDVLSGGKSWVFQFVEGDPHPISYIRVLLGIEMCRYFYGKGHWDSLGTFWKKRYPLKNAERETGRILYKSEKLLNKIVSVCLTQPLNAFGGRSIIQIIHPKRVSPAALLKMEKLGGAALYNSPHWLYTECLRLMGLSGYKLATTPGKSEAILKQQHLWMKKLGRSLQSAPVN